MIFLFNHINDASQLFNLLLNSSICYSTLQTATQLFNLLLNSSILSGNEVEAIRLVPSKVTLDSSGRQIGELRNEK